MHAGARSSGEGRSSARECYARAMFLLALLACPPPELTPAPDGPTWEDPDGAQLVVNTDGTILWTSAAGVERTVTVGIGTVETLDEGTCSYDPWWLYDDRVDRSTLASEVMGFDMDETCTRGTYLFEATAAEWDGTNYRLSFDEGQTATLSVDNLGPGLRLSLVHDDANWAPYAFLRVSVAEDEEFYGLGEQFETVGQRGQVRAMQIELTAMESAYNEAHVPIPLLVSSANWGLLVDSFRPGVVDAAGTNPEAVEVMFQQKDGDFSVDLYAPERSSLVTGRYWQRTGAPEVPPDWAFAPLQWRNVAASETVILDDASTLRELELPTGVIWVDNPWQTSYNSMQPDEVAFPNWDAMVDTLHATGFRFMAWTTPYVEESDPDYTEFSEAGYFIEGAQLFSDFGKLMDLTNPAAQAAWEARVTAAKDRGIEGWKLDYGEDVQLGAGGGRMPDWIFANGEDERTMHHKFVKYFHAPYANPYRDEGMLLGRAGCIGGQVITDVIWPGDLDNGFERWGDSGCDDGTCIGGLVTAIHGGTSLSVSGYPFYASDTGGYRGGRPSKESFVRWMEYAAILPIWQYGGAGENHNAWDFTEYEGSTFDQEVLDAFRRYAVLHTRLWPYYQAEVAEMLAEGEPMVLPQGLADPAGGVHHEENFFVGDDLFVAPVLEAGTFSLSVEFPTGNWVHWWTGEGYEGGVTGEVESLLGEGPLFQRWPSAIPMLRRTVETLSPVEDESVDSWYGDRGALNARIIPGEGAGFRLATGEAVAAESLASIVLSAGSDYVGWDVEVYAPDFVGVAADGVALEPGDEDCESCFVVDEPWVRVILPEGSATLTVE